MPRKPPQSQEPDEQSQNDTASSAASSTSSPYTASRGPGFDPNKPPEHAEGPPVEEEPTAIVAEWDEDKVRDWLRNGGDAVHAAFGVGEYDWAMTQRDLERIAPPLTRVMNRYDPARAAAAFSDPAAVAIGFGLYGWRSALERGAVLKQRKRAEEQPAADVAAPPPEPAFDGQGPAVVGPTYADRLRATRGDA